MLKITKIIKNNKSKLVLKYTAYGVILLFSVYFFILFFLPYGRIKKAAEETLSGRTGARFTIAEVSYSFPFHIRFGGIKAFNNAGTVPYGSVKEAKIDVSPYVLVSSVFGAAPVNVNMRSISVKSFDAGFIRIPEIALNSVRVALKVGTGKNPSAAGTVAVTGNIRFNGGLTGSLTGIDAAFYPKNGVLKFKGGMLKLKPSAETSKSLSVIFGTVFKKSGNGYYAYNLKNRIF